jgi:lysophospholipase L1-like esterase
MKMNKYWGLIFILFAINSFAQKNTAYPISDYEEQYKFINFEKNKIEFFDNKEAFREIFQKFDDLVFEGKNNLNIIQFGGSHIQADVWSGQFRSNLQNSHPGIKSGRGLVFPYKMAKSNHPWNYFTEYTGTWKVCKNLGTKNSCVLGVMGLNAQTSDANAEISVFLRKNHVDYKHNKVQIFHQIDKNAFQISLKDTSNIKSIEIDQENGFTLIEFKKSIDTLKLKLDKTESQQNNFMLFGIRLIDDRNGIVFDAVGNNGASVPSYLNCDLLPEQLKFVNPDLIIFSMGINDAHSSDFSGKQYEAHYDSLMKKITKVLPNVKFILTTNNDSYFKKKHPELNALEVRETMFRLAKKHKNVAVWDMFEIMGGLNSVLEWEKNKLAKSDKIHLTREGYVIMGDLFYFAFMDAYKNILFE